MFNPDLVWLSVSLKVVGFSAWDSLVCGWGGFGFRPAKPFPSRFRVGAAFVAVWPFGLFGFF